MIHLLHTVGPEEWGSFGPEERGSLGLGLINLLFEEKSNPQHNFFPIISHPKKMSGTNGDDRGLLWRLPVIKPKEIGKLGPGIGFGAGCGIGLGAGLFGGTGLGFGFPGLQIGFGAGAGCGIGVGFGYGLGRGIAYDENRRYTNVGKLFKGTNGSRKRLSEDRVDTLLDDLIENTKKLIRATSKELEKWR